jgi:hypothetical protein
VAKHHFRKPVKAPVRQSPEHGSSVGNAPSGDGSPFIPPAAGGSAPTPPMGTPMAGGGASPPPMTTAARMKGRYGSQGDDDAGM